MSLCGDVIRRTADFVDRHRLIPNGASVLIALSGGPDSVCLFHILKTLAPDRGWHLSALHMNHMLRGEDSDTDEAFVRTLCDHSHVPLLIERTDIRARMRTERQSLETAARDARYAFFQSAADEEERRHAEPKTPYVVRIAVAHHQDDQAETLLMHLFRGSGLDGLAGIAPRNGRVIRPLLPLSKEDILSFLSREGIPFRTDETNFEGHATRNRVRQELLPLAASIFGGNPTRRLASAAALLRADADWLNREAERILKTETDACGIPVSALNRLDPALATRLVRGLYEMKTGSRIGLESAHVQAILSLAEVDVRTGRVDLPDLFCAVREKDRLSIQTQEERAAPTSVSAPVPVPIRMPGRVLFASGSLLASELSPDPEAGPAFSRSRLQGAVLRTRRTGDRIRPSGGSGSRLLRRFFIDRHVPSEERDRMPLVAVGGEIAWIPGLAASSAFLWKEGTDPLEDRVWLAYCPDS